jgi:lipid-A-disaccharide synthase
MSEAGSLDASLKVLIVAGESSGDLYGADLVSELKSKTPQGQIDFFGCGGERMRQAGVEILVDMHQLAVLGPLEVLSHLTHLFSALRQLENAAKGRRPHLAILVDFPDFNLRLAKKLGLIGIPIIYLISPQIWAWRGNRIKWIQKIVNRMLVILPFEKGFYSEKGVDVEYIGHPLIDRVSTTTSKRLFFEQRSLDEMIPTVSLLPGSRKKEIIYNLPILLRTARLLHWNRPIQFLLPLVSDVHSSIANRILKEEVGELPLNMVIDDTYNAVGHSDLAVIASGTATLEAALLGTPLISVFKISILTWIIGQYLVRVPHYCLVNLIAEKRIVPELYQAAFTEETLYNEISAFLDDESLLNRARIELNEVRTKLGGGGAMARAAEHILTFLENPAR